MAVLSLILIATFGISLISFAGALLLFLKETLLNRILLVLVAFSAGALMGGAFLHLLPETVEKLGANLNIFLFLILGFCLFFILENFIHWHHHHAKDHPEIMPFSYLVLISDGLHNFIDGVVIAAAFVVSVPVGIAAALAVMLHEIPQEIGDFGILIYGGVKKGRALFLNFFSAVAAVLGGLIGYFLSGVAGERIVFLLPLAAGAFIYVAAADLIPEIKKRAQPQRTLAYFLVFLLGIALMWLLRLK